MHKTIRILGLDPGLRNLGWGWVEVRGSHLSFGACGIIKPDANLPLAERLARLFEATSALVCQHQPDEAAMEETYVNDNPRSALYLGQARGAAMAGLGVTRLPVQEFAPATIKKAVTGSGRADKEQVAAMIARLLPNAEGASRDAADALAIAICAAYHRPTRLLALQEARA